LKYPILILISFGWFDQTHGQEIPSTLTIPSNSFGFEILASVKQNNTNTFRLGAIGMKKISPKFQLRYGLGISTDRYSKIAFYRAQSGINALLARDTNYIISARRSSFLYLQMGFDYQIGRHRVGLTFMPSYWLGYTGTLIKIGNQFGLEITEGFISINGVDAYSLSSGIYYLYEFNEWASLSAELISAQAIKNKFNWSGSLLGRNGINLNMGFVFHFN